MLARSLIRHVRFLKSARSRQPFCGIFLVEHIGDIIACEPVIGWLRREHPDAFIAWIVKPEYAELVSSHPDLDAVLTLDLLRSVGDVIRSGAFDVSLDLHVNRKPTEIGSDVHNKTWGNPSVDAGNYFRYGSLLQSLTKAAGISVASTGPTMHIPESVRNSIDSLSLPERFVVIHASSNVATKDWLPEQWSALVTHILATSDLHVLEVGLQSIVTSNEPRFRSLCGRLSLLETAEVIRRATFFIGVDSGPAHMANAWRRPALLLFSRFSWQGDWVPYDGLFAENASERIVRAPGLLSEFPVSAVIAKLEQSKTWLAVSAPRDERPPVRARADGELGSGPLSS